VSLYCISLLVAAAVPDRLHKQIVLMIMNITALKMCAAGRPVAGSADPFTSSSSAPPMSGPHVLFCKTQ